MCTLIEGIGTCSLHSRPELFTINGVKVELLLIRFIRVSLSSTSFGIILNRFGFLLLTVEKTQLLTSKGLW